MGGVGVALDQSFAFQCCEHPVHCLRSCVGSSGEISRTRDTGVAREHAQSAVLGGGQVVLLQSRVRRPAKRLPRLAQKETAVPFDAAVALPDSVERRSQKQYINDLT